MRSRGTAVGVGRRGAEPALVFLQQPHSSTERRGVIFRRGRRSLQQSRVRQWCHVEGLVRYVGSYAEHDKWASVKPSCAYWIMPRALVLESS